MPLRAPQLSSPHTLTPNQIFWDTPKKKIIFFEKNPKLQGKKFGYTWIFFFEFLSKRWRFRTFFAILEKYFGIPQEKFSVTHPENAMINIWGGGEEGFGVLSGTHTFGASHNYSLE